MQNKLIVISLIFGMLFVISSCQSQSIQESASSTTVITRDTTSVETTSSLPMITVEEVETLIANGVSLKDLIARMGNNYKECGSGAWILEWPLADGTYFQIWIQDVNRISDYRISSETLYRDYSHLFTTESIITTIPQ